jgi:hypothetical protein
MIRSSVEYRKFMFLIVSSESGRYLFDDRSTMSKMSDAFIKQATIGQLNAVSTISVFIILVQYIDRFRYFK